MSPFFMLAILSAAASPLASVTARMRSPVVAENAGHVWMAFAIRGQERQAARLTMMCAHDG
jgi:hypothetical protein